MTFFCCPRGPLSLVWSVDPSRIAGTFAGRGFWAFLCVWNTPPILRIGRDIRIAHLFEIVMSDLPAPPCLRLRDSGIVASSHLSICPTVPRSIVSPVHMA